jgi:hypothetical protein
MSASLTPVEDSWFVSSEGQSYGPYSSDQIAVFVREGRVSSQTPVRRGREPYIMAGLHGRLTHLFAGSKPTPSPSVDVAGEEQQAKVVIIAELRTGSSIAFEAAIARLGQHYRLNQFVWLVHTNLPFGQLRKELTAQVGRNDPLFISDTTNRRTAWINFGPGAEATISALWRGAKTH